MREQHFDNKLHHPLSLCQSKKNKENFYKTFYLGFKFNATTLFWETLFIKQAFTVGRRIQVFESFNANVLSFKVPKTILIVPSLAVVLVLSPHVIVT